MLISTVGVAIVVAAGVLIWRATRDGSVDAEVESGDWNEVVFVDRANGAVTSVGTDGNAGSTLPATTRTLDVHVEGARLALVEASQIVLTDLGNGSPDIIPTETDSVVSRLPIADSLWLAVGKASGGNMLLVNGLTGDTYDFGELASFASPRFFLQTLRFDPEGRVFAVADANNFQTVVVDTAADPAVATFLPDQPLAVSSERAVTSQVVGQQADLTLFDGEGSELATVKDQLPAGGILDGDDVIVTSIDGAVSTFGEGDESAERLGTVAVPAGGTVSSVHPSAEGSRIVVRGDVFEAVVDLDGQTVFTTTFTSSLGDFRVEPTWSCLPVGGGEGFHSIVDLDTGEQLADLTGVAVIGVSADGCTVIGTRSGATEVVGNGGSVPLGRLRAAWLAPDGRAVVIQTTTGTTELRTIDDEWALGDAVDLSEHAPANAIVNFRQT
jgi:hypothetical protein